MDTTQMNCEGEDPLKTARRLGDEIQSLIASFVRMQEELRQKEQEIVKLRQAVEMLQNDPWASRVTYDNVVELIASNEDAAQRDISRKFIEPLLKKEQVRQLRRDVKKKVKELEEAEGSDRSRTFVTIGTLNGTLAQQNVVLGNYTDVHDNNNVKMDVKEK